MIAHKGVPLHGIHHPPRQILQQSFYTPASSVTNSLGLPSGDRAPNHGVSRSGRFPPSVKVRSQQNKPKGKSFVRSAHLKDVIERNSRRKSSESQSAAGPPIVRQRWRPDPKEVDQLFDLFSKYDDILDHLARKNRKLKSFVNGETKEYPSNFSASTVEILETLEKLKLQREKSFGLGGGLDVSERLRQIKRLHRPKSADPRLRGGISGQRSSSNARYSERTTRGNLASSRNNLSRRENIGEGWRSSSAPRLREYDRDSSLTKRRRTPTRFRSTNRAYAGHLDNRETSGGHKQDYSSLKKLASNQSRRSNYQFQTMTSSKEDKPTSTKSRYLSSQNAQSKYSRDFDFARRTTKHNHGGISSYLPGPSRHASRGRANEIGRSLQGTQRIMSVPSTDSDDLLQSKTYTKDKSFRRSQRTFHTGGTKSRRNQKLIGRYGDSSDSERPTLSRRPESNSPTQDRVFENRYGRKRDISVQQSHSSELENHVGATTPSISEKKGARSSKTATRYNEESRDEPVSPPSLRRITSKAAVRSSPPRFQPKIWSSTNQQGEATLDDSDAGQDSEFTPTKEPRKSFLPVSQMRRPDSAYHNAFSTSESSYTKSLAPSEKARRLRSQVEQVYTSSQLLRESQEKMREDILNIKDNYMEKNHALEDRISKAMHVDLLDHNDDASWDQIPTRSKTESFNIIEFQDGTIHLEDAPDIVTQTSYHDYHVEDGVIHVDDEYEEDNSESFDVIKVDDEFAHNTAEDSDLVSMDSKNESQEPYQNHTLSLQRRTMHRKASYGKDQQNRMREQHGSARYSKSAKDSTRRSEAPTAVDSREEISSGSSGNYSTQNPLTIDESNSMIVQERPKRLGRNVDIREVVLKQNHVTKDTLREMPESLANWSDSCSVTNVSENTLQKDEDVNLGGLKDVITDLRSRPNSIAHSGAVANAEIKVTNPNDLMLSSPKEVSLTNEGQIVVQWRDHCGGLPGCGIASM